MKISPRLLALALLLMGLPAAAQSHVKIHKDKVAISAPNEAGMVLLRGAPGAVTSSSAVRLTVENLTTEQKITVPLGPDGSFETIIAAGPGDKMFALARNDEKKRSQGTFTVPAPVAGVSVVADGDTGPTPDAGKAAPTPGTTESPGKLVVLIVVTNPSTNEIVAVKQLTGRPRSQATDLADLGKRIVERLAIALERELYLGAARPTLRSPVSRRRLDEAARKAKAPAQVPAEAQDASDEHPDQDQAVASPNQPAQHAQPDAAGVPEPSPPQETDE